MLHTVAQAIRNECKFLALRAGTAFGASAGYNRTVLHWKTDLWERIVRYWLPRWWWYTRGRFFMCSANRCEHWRWGAGTRTHGFCGLAGVPLDTTTDPETPVRGGFFEELLMMLGIGFASGIVTFVAIVVWIAFN